MSCYFFFLWCIISNTNYCLYGDFMSVFDYLTGPFAFGRFLNKSMLKKEKTKYYTDSSGNRIANIPYSEYIREAEIPKGSVVPYGLSESNTAEENGKAIQGAIDSLKEKGGTVFIPKGRYFTNTIYLKSNITLFVSNQAELVSISCEDNEKSKVPLCKAVICAENAENICLTGGGTINGNGLTYTNEPKVAEPFYALEKFNTYLRVIEPRKRGRGGKNTVRNNIINFFNCKNINVNNIILKDPAVWTCVFTNCFNVYINNVVLDNHTHIANSDGIDICGGENYTIRHCFIATGDDAIVLKPIDFPIKKVKVSDCEIMSGANCFKIGTETQYDVSDITVDNCYFFMPNGITRGYSGIAIESCDGANIKDVNISDIIMDGISSPLLIWLGNRFKYDKKEVGTIQNISLKNIKAERIEMPCAIVGCVHNKTAHYVKNVSIDNFTATYRDTGEQLNIRKKVGEYTMGGYPDITRVSHIYYKSHEKSKYWDLPCYGVCVKHAENIDYKNIKIKPRSCNKREEFYLDDVK